MMGRSQREPGFVRPRRDEAEPRPLAQRLRFAAHRNSLNVHLPAAPLLYWADVSGTAARSEGHDGAVVV